MKEIINILKENKPLPMVKLAPGHIRIPLMIDGVAVNLVIRRDDYEYLTAEKTTEKKAEQKTKKEKKKKYKDDDPVIHHPV